MSESSANSTATTFVTVLGWVLIIFTAFGLVTSVMQNVMVSFMFPALDSQVPEAQKMPRGALVAFRILAAFMLCVAAFLLFSAWSFLKRRNWARKTMLGSLRQTILLVGAALCSGVVYLAFDPAPGSALVGGLFVASATGVAFLCWSISNRALFQSGLRIFWLLAACWFAYTLWASPLSLSAVHVAAWLVGFVVAIGPIRRFGRLPNNALQATREDARA